MKRAPFLALCGLLACAHSQPGTPSGPEAPTGADATPAPTAAPSPEVSAAMMRAGTALDSGEFDLSLADLQALWDGGHRTEEVAWYATFATLGLNDHAAAFTWLERATQLGMSDPAALLHRGMLEPLRKMPGYDALVARARENAVKARAEGNVGAGLQKASAAEVGLSESALAELVKAAEEAGSSSLVVLRHGKLVGEWHFFGGETQRYETMSATKAVVALAIGLLIDDGKIPSADAPVSTFFPEWKEGKKGRVTLRHLLGHTSGLAANRTAWDIYKSQDFVRYALDAEVVDEPGSRYFYNNKATNLLAGVVERASGEKMDVYLARRLFGPLGIRDVEWQKDPSGNPLGMSGLRLHPVDFAKVGQLLLQKGEWKGRRILSEAWIRECTSAPAHPVDVTSGLLWWLVYEKSFRVLPSASVEEARRNGMAEEVLARLKDIVDRPIPSADFQRALSERLGGVKDLMGFMEKSAREPIRATAVGPPRGYAARGQDGQVLMVVPEADLVAVRLAVADGRVGPGLVGFPHFTDLVLKLVPPVPPASTTR